MNRSTCFRATGDTALYWKPIYCTGRGHYDLVACVTPGSRVALALSLIGRGRTRKGYGVALAVYRQANNQQAKTDQRNNPGHSSRTKGLFLSFSNLLSLFLSIVDSVMSFYCFFRHSREKYPTGDLLVQKTVPLSANSMAKCCRSLAMVIVSSLSALS